MTRFRRSQLDERKGWYEFEEGVVKGLKRKRRRHLSASASLLSTNLSSQLSSPKSLPNPSRLLKSPRKEAQTLAQLGSGVDAHFPRSAHDYHAEQGRHEQKRLGTASLPQVGFSICSSGLVAVGRISVGWLPSALEPLFRRGLDFSLGRTVRVLESCRFPCIR